MNLKPGQRLASATCATEVIVVKAPADDVDVRCGGSPMVAKGDDVTATPVAAEHAAGTLIGKRYADDELGLELLCTKGGEGSLSVGDVALLIRDAKPLPSSD